MTISSTVAVVALATLWGAQIQGSSSSSNLSKGRRPTEVPLNCFQQLKTCKDEFSKANYTLGLLQDRWLDASRCNSELISCKNVSQALGEDILGLKYELNKSNAKNEELSKTVEVLQVALIGTGALLVISFCFNLRKFVREDCLPFLRSRGVQFWFQSLNLSFRNTV